MSETFYFAYVEDDSVAFDATVHNVVDEDIFDMHIEHAEGQIAELTITIKNPRVGLLNPGRKLWAYLSYRHSSGSGIIPLFFGVLTAIPSDLFGELIVLKFHARPSDYIAAKQAVAETLRVAPFYDPVFLSIEHRDDPDAILEAWSSLYHVDRVTLAMSASDILQGEDGTIQFEEDHAFYDSVKMSLGEAPLSTVQIRANVKWTQRCIGSVIGPTANITSYTGGSFKSDWPKPGASLGGGWRVEDSYVIDVLDTEHAHTFNISRSWRNNDKEAGDCSSLNMTYNATYTTWPGISIEGATARQEQTGLCDPFGFASLSSDTPGVNIPAKMNTTGKIALQWILNCTWALRYDAKRDFNEDLTINVTANLQQTVVSPNIGQITEVMKVQGADVGMPLEISFAWTDFISKVVPIATVIFPNDRTTAGGMSYQIAIQAGVAGTDEPTFSDIPGTLTNDNTVVWASLGDRAPDTQAQWTNSTPVPFGEIMIIEPKTFHIKTGEMETTGASYFFLCTGAGVTNSVYATMEYLPAIIDNDQLPSQPVPFTEILGPGDIMQSNIGGGSNGPAIPGTGGTVTDGSVTWTNLGTNPPILPIPIGGTMTNVTARNYFSTDRGLQSVEYLICKARARLRHRARCVKISWDAPFENCIGLTGRHNATLIDPRLPGGAATGKVISYALSADKDGKMIGHVEIGVPVGFGGHVSDIAGVPGYTAATGYMVHGYQAYTGAQFSTANDDIAFTAPVFSPFDDGLVFPLQGFPGTMTIVHPIQNAELVAKLAQSQTPLLNQVPSASTLAAGGGFSNLSLLEHQSALDWLHGGEGTFLVECAPVAAEILIQPVTNGPFNGTYFVSVTPLEIPQGIDLSAG